MYDREFSNTVLPSDQMVTASPSSPTEEAFQRQEKLLAEAHEALDVLGSKLFPVLAASLRTNPNVDGSPPEPNGDCPLLTGIKRNNESLSRLIDGLFRLSKEVQL